MRYEWQQILWSVGGGVLGEIGCQCLNNVEIIEKGPAFFILAENRRNYVKNKKLFEPKRIIRLDSN